MDTNIVVYSQCAECEEPGLFLDPGRCARCLSGYEPIESDDKDDVRGLRFACAGKLELLP